MEKGKFAAVGREVVVCIVVWRRAERVGIRVERVDILVERVDILVEVEAQQTVESRRTDL